MFLAEKFDHEIPLKFDHEMPLMLLSIKKVSLQKQKILGIVYIQSCLKTSG